MIRYLYADQLNRFPALAGGMFRDRADQFKRRLGWDVSVDAQGYERDRYDDANPLYVIWQMPDGSHGGSMRFLPTTTPVMVNDCFADLTDGVKISSPLIWEVTRFCISPRATSVMRTSARLMLGAAELGQQFYLNHAVGVFDARMVRIYRALGWSPEITGTRGSGATAISVGLWDFHGAPFKGLCQRADVGRLTSKDWLRHGFQMLKTGLVPA